MLEKAHIQLQEGPVAERALRAVCFDLDGTLLPMDIDEFMSAYFHRIAAYVADHGVDQAAFMSALKKGTQAMAANHDGQTNEAAFWAVFHPAFEEASGSPLSEEERQRMRELADAFYAEDFGHIGDGFTANPAAARVVRTLQEKGYPLVLATMPMFPRPAVEHRLAWAGVDPKAFARITSYENSTSVKPKQTYFAEVLAAVGVPGDQVCMVGNNTMEDFAFLDLGVEGFLVTDWLLNPIDVDIQQMRHGTFADLEAWAEALPVCADPASDIRSGAIPPEESAAALEDNAVVPIDLDAAERRAAAVAQAVAGDHGPGAASALKVDE